MLARTCTIAALTALVGLAGSASGATRTAEFAKPTSQAAPAKAMTFKKARGPGVVKPIKTGTTVVAITAFPTGGKGSGTEATCELWANQLQEDERALDEATEKDDVIGAYEGLNEDIDHALDAGCAVIYSAASPQLDTVKTVSIAAARSGAGMTTQTWSAGPSVAYISAFPAGGKGSGTEATCALWSKELQRAQEAISYYPEADVEEASEGLEEAVDNALDAGCVVIH